MKDKYCEELLHAENLVRLFEKDGLKQQYDEAYLYLRYLKEKKNVFLSQEILHELKGRIANELVNRLLLKAETTLLNAHFIEALISSTRLLTPENKRAYTARLNDLASYHVANKLILGILSEIENTDQTKVVNKLDFTKKVIFKISNNYGLFYRKQLLQNIERIESILTLKNQTHVEKNESKYVV